MKELCDGVTQFDLGIANGYLIRGPDTLTLVDTGGSRSPRKLQGALRQQGLGWRDLDRIIITHAHFDHAGGLAAAQAASGAEVWAHRLDAPFIRTEAQAPRPPPQTLSSFDRWVGTIIAGPQPTAPVDRELAGDEPLGEVYPGMELVHLPGHSPGQIGLWLPQKKLLLGGDVVTHFVPWRLTLPLAAYTEDMRRAEHSVLRVDRMDVRILGVGHGPALVGNAAVYLKRLAERINRRWERLQGTVRP